MKITWEKIELFIHGMFFRLTFLIFFALFIGVFVYAYHMDQQLEDVGESAPFAEEMAVVVDTDMIETDAIAKAHRTRREMQVWVVEAVSELLNLDRQNKAMVFRVTRPYFTEASFKQYEDYLKTDNVLADIEGGKMRLGAIVDEAPQQLNDGVIGGKYRWLFDVPVLISVTPTQGAPQNKKGTLRIQLGRTMDENNPDKLIIESWSMMPRR